MIVDAHNHLHLLTPSDPAAYGVDRCAACTSRADEWDALAELSRRHPSVTPCFGIHPWFAAGAPPGWRRRLEALLTAIPAAGVGEIGLDRTGRAPDLATQVPLLTEQLEIAAALRRPAVLHCVRAHGPLFDILASARQLPRILLHGYGGSAEMVRRFLSLPAPVSFSLTAPGLLDHIPPAHLLVESDAAPDNGRTPAAVPEFCRRHGLDLAQLADNYARLFGASGAPEATISTAT